MNVASTLEEMYRVLAPEPLDPVKNRDFYIPRPSTVGEADPIVVLLHKLRLATPEERFFLAGHVGSGKSTELARLAAEPELLKRFTVVRFRFEEQEWAHLDARQILFRVAAELYAYGLRENVLKGKLTWEPFLRELDRKIYGEKGLAPREGSVQVEWNALFLKIRQELKLSEHRRAGFRAFGDSEVTLLRDLVNALAEDIERGLSKRNDPGRLLVIVDDLDKVREPDRQKDIFESDLNTLFAPRVTMLLTLPAGVVFGGSQLSLKNRTHYLRPAQVTRRGEFALPADAAASGPIEWLTQVARARVALELASDETLALAALYSGGVAREFFHLLREAALLGIVESAARVDRNLVERAIREARVRLQYGLYPSDHQALVAVHKTHQLASAPQAAYLDRSIVLEYNHDELWYEVTPLLWPLLAEWAGG